MRIALRDISDEELLTSIYNDDEAAFAEIYNRYWKRLYFLAHKHLKSPEESEEIVQEIFYTLWQKRHRLQIKSLPVYFAAMARYAVYHQAAKKAPVHLTGENIETIAATEFQWDNKFLLEAINKLANTLPEKCRMVFIHNKLLDQPLTEVAQSLNISIKTAEAHLSKALKSVRSKLGDKISLFFL